MSHDYLLKSFVSSGLCTASLPVNEAADKACLAITLANVSRSSRLLLTHQVHDIPEQRNTLRKCPRSHQCCPQQQHVLESGSELEPKCVRYGWNSGLRLGGLQLRHSPSGRDGVGLLSAKEGPGLGQAGVELCKALGQEHQNCCPGSHENPQVSEGAWTVIY